MLVSDNGVAFLPFQWHLHYLKVARPSAFNGFDSHIDLTVAWPFFPFRNQLSYVSPKGGFFDRFMQVFYSQPGLRSPPSFRSDSSLCISTKTTDFHWSEESFLSHHWLSLEIHVIGRDKCSPTPIQYLNNRSCGQNLSSTSGRGYFTVHPYFFKKLTTAWSETSYEPESSVTFFMMIWYQKKLKG